MGNIRWNIITREKRFLNSLKHGRHYWCRLCSNKKDCQDFEIKKLDEYHDFYVQSNTLLTADVFENFQNMCLEIYELDTAYFLSTPRLAWQTALKKAKVKLDLLTDIDMLILEKKVSEVDMSWYSQYAEAYNKYMKNYEKYKES